MGKIQCPHMDLYSQAHKVFDRDFFKHTQVKNKACITINLLICLNPHINQRDFHVVVTGLGTRYGKIKKEKIIG